MIHEYSEVEQIILDNNLNTRRSRTAYRVSSVCSVCGKEFDSSVNALYKKKKIVCPLCTSKETCIEKYGVDNPAKTEEVKQKIKDVFLDKYGVENISSLRKSEEPKIKVDKKETKKIILKPTIIFDKNETGFSQGEKEVLEFIKTFYTGSIIENDKELISPLELDIVVPDKKIAIEFDGVYWHSVQAGKDENYHLNKTNLCNEKGYRLLHIFEDEWVFKRDIVNSIIKISLGFVDNKIYARKCIIKEITSKEANVFYNENHIQGGIGSSVNIGLFYNDELVSCLSFAKPRFSTKYNWEITRFANRLNTSVIGGFSKLFKYFTKNYNGSIITYSDKRLFNGSIYRNNGFTELNSSKPSYFYIRNDIVRHSRVSFQKHKLSALLEEFDENLTEKENMRNNGYCWIYDCGNYVFEYRRE